MDTRRTASSRSTACSTFERRGEGVEQRLVRVREQANQLLLRHLEVLFHNQWWRALWAQPGSERLAHGLDGGHVGVGGERLALYVGCARRLDQGGEV